MGTNLRRCFWVIFLAVLLGVIYAWADCTNAIYLGFDSRLTPTILGRLTLAKEAITGFEIVHGIPTVAFTDRLVALRNQQGRTLPIADKVRGIAVDSTGGLWVQTSSAVKRLGTSGFSPDGDLASNVHGRLLDSGAPVLIDARQRNGSVQFLLMRADGDQFPIATVMGQLRAASWDKMGLAAVVNDSLLLWDAGTPQLIRLRQDSGLHSAQDVCLVGHNRVVVALPNVVLLITQNSQTVIAGFGAQCRWQDGVLYLLDKRSGLIWSVKGLDRLGTKKDDLAYARQLVNNMPTGASESSPRFLEAARLVGCREAERMLQARQKSSGSSKN